MIFCYATHGKKTRKKKRYIPFRLPLREIIFKKKKKNLFLSVIILVHFSYYELILTTEEQWLLFSPLSSCAFILVSKSKQLSFTLLTWPAAWKPRRGAGWQDRVWFQRWDAEERAKKHSGTICSDEVVCWGTFSPCSLQKRVWNLVNFPFIA